MCETQALRYQPLARGSPTLCRVAVDLRRVEISAKWPVLVPCRFLC